MARVDHIQTLRKAPHLALHPHNLRTLCVRCDNARHRYDRLRKDSQREVVGHDEQGYPLGSDWAEICGDKE